ncbi:DUF1206 domain-containing protein [Streptomyces sp. G-G2]|uniref:DUF1206 domain-containing protein n=1 Tax=Streptomyces sp. G-G2 TaxID=3046201 RepID=UPI0024BBB421|nr:DUF1206 domain-containing protein [Streptomyces sp. G-G2]MDJ0385055.1 DUF1206 domain-containing protein [Streptomyces sp. G-G2]
MTRGVAQEGKRTASRGGAGREVAARCGLVARGVLYVLTGVIAVRVAFGENAGEADRQGALQTLAGRPFGAVMVWAVGIGLVGMVLWRLSEAAFGAAGPEGGKATKRLASAGRAVFYATAAFSVLSFAAGSGSGGSGDDQSRDVTAKALGLPAGQWLVGAAGLAIAAAGVTIAVRAAQCRFRKHLTMGGMSAPWKRAVDVLGVSGGVARGAVFTAAGGFAGYAAWRYDPGQAKGVDDTLRAFTGTPAGPWLLAAVAVGLMLFGVFSWAMARWREV